MSSSAVLRLACAGDLPEILALERATAEAPHWSEDAYRNYVEQGSVEQAPSALQHKALLVGVADGCVRGFAAATAVAEEAELESIVVAETARRSGLGGRLLHAVQTWARLHGAQSLLLEVRAANAGAQAFYAAQGFAREGLRGRYYRDPVEDAVLLRVGLPDLG